VEGEDRCPGFDREPLGLGQQGACDTLPAADRRIICWRCGADK
jgi:hypothetical protein